MSTKRNVCHLLLTNLDLKQESRCCSPCLKQNLSTVIKKKNLHHDILSHVYKLGYKNVDVKNLTTTPFLNLQVSYHSDQRLLNSMPISMSFLASLVSQQHPIFTPWNDISVFFKTSNVSEVCHTFIETS